MKLSSTLPFVLAVTVYLLILSVSGCTRHLEQATPAAVLSPTTDQPIPGYDEGGTGAPVGVTQAAPASSPYSPYIGRPLSGAVEPVSEKAYAASITRFKQAYASANSPRIAIYFNRALSDEVREWFTPTRSVVTGRGQKVSVGGGSAIVTPGGAVVDAGSEAKVEGQTDTDRGIAAYNQRHIENMARESPEESWMWRFEDNFLQPFIKGGAKIIDRATILRLAAATEKQGDPYSLDAVKKIEMDALIGHADILVEILVTRDHASPSGYAFRATAKEIKTGTIVGSVTKTGRDYRYEKSFEAVATPSGYKLRKGSAALILENVSQELSVDLMNSLSISWKK